MGSVTECGVRGYETRHAAKQAANGHHDNHVRPYKCRDCDYWHVGALPPEVIRGDMTAAEFYEEKADAAAAAREHRRSPEATLRRARLKASRLLARDAAVLAEMWADRQIPGRDDVWWKESYDDSAKMIADLSEILRELAGPGGQP